MTTAAVLANFGLPAWRYMTLPAGDVERVALVAIAKRAVELEEQAARRARG